MSTVTLARESGPLLSCLIPFMGTDSQAALERTLASLSRQTCGSWEAWVLCSQVSDLGVWAADPRIHALTLTGQGYGPVLLEGLTHATGVYLAVVMPGEVWGFSQLERAVEAWSQGWSAVLVACWGVTGVVDGPAVDACRPVLADGVTVWVPRVVAEQVSSALSGSCAPERFAIACAAACPTARVLRSIDFQVTRRTLAAEDLESLWAWQDEWRAAMPRTLKVLAALPDASSACEGPIRHLLELASRGHELRVFLEDSAGEWLTSLTECATVITGSGWADAVAWCHLTQTWGDVGLPGEPSGVELVGGLGDGPWAMPPWPDLRLLRLIPASVNILLGSGAWDEAAVEWVAVAKRLASLDRAMAFVWCGGSPSDAAGTAVGTALGRLAAAGAVVRWFPQATEAQLVGAASCLRTVLLDLRIGGSFPVATMLAARTCPVVVSADVAEALPVVWSAQAGSRAEAINQVFWALGLESFDPELRVAEVDALWSTTAVSSRILPLMRAMLI